MTCDWKNCAEPAEYKNIQPYAGKMCLRHYQAAVRLCNNRNDWIKMADDPTIRRGRVSVEKWRLHTRGTR